MYYTLVLLAANIFGWRSPVAAVAVCQMAIGDGIADIFGRRFGKTKWPFSKSKSVEGSLAFVAGGFGSSLGMIHVLHATGLTALTAAAAAPAVLLISVHSTVMAMRARHTRETATCATATRAAATGALRGGRASAGLPAR